MFTDAAREFVSAPRFGYLATVGDDGMPHNVPIWYDVIAAPGGGDEVVMIADRASRKVRNLQARPGAALAVGGGVGDDEGYLIRGTATIHDDADREITRAMTHRYESPTDAERLLAEWADDDMVVIRIAVTSVVRVYG